MKTKSNTSGLKEGKAYRYCTADEYVGQPKGAYGAKSGLQPQKARRMNYTPDVKAPKR